MQINYILEAGEKLTNFRIAESVFNLCDGEHEKCNEIDAEIVAKMILLQCHKDGKD